MTLSKVLILHPVAAGLTLIMVILAAVSHTHAAFHSARYLLILFVLILLSFLITLVAFIIDIILFLPHMAFGTYLVLAAAVVMAICTVVSFAMRRSVVSRKARKARIAENAEMSGENFYNREGQIKPMTNFSSIPAPSTTISGANGGADGLPVFASYESGRQKDAQVSDERIPLTQVQTADRSPPTVVSDLSQTGPSRSASQDRYGNQPGQVDAYGAQGQGYGPNGRPRGGMAGYRGGGSQRGGGRGGYGAPMRGRGGYGPPGRGGMAPRGRGGYYGQSREGYGGPGMAGAAMAGGALAGAAMGRGGRPGYDRRPGPDSYDAYNNPPAAGQGEYGYGSHGNSGYSTAEADLPRAESPPPLPTIGSATAGFGQAIEMEAAQADAHHGYGAPPVNAIRDSDTDVAGMVNMQQGHPGSQVRPGYMSDGSKYSTDEYVAPRTGWSNDAGRKSPRGQSPIYNADGRPAPVSHRGPTSPLAGGPSPAPGGYYEDVEPRYEASSMHPAHAGPPAEPVYEDAHAMSGSRSPAGSERSNFTSVSQRGVNPRWNPQQHPMPVGHIARRAVQNRQDMILDNPDFQIGRAGKPQHGNPGGMVPGSAYPNAPM